MSSSSTTSNNVNVVTSNYMQFQALAQAGMAMSIVSAIYRHPYLSAVSMAFLMGSVMFSALITTIVPPWVLNYNMTEERMDRLFSPLGMASYVLFFLGSILTFAAVADSGMFMGNKVMGSIFFIAVIVVFAGYSLYYLCDTRFKSLYRARQQQQQAAPAASA